MITVMPAKSTARPAVSTAAIAACAGLEPLVEPVAEAGEDEERVVDADAEADHRRQLRRELGGVEDVGAERDQAEADAEGEERGEERQAHRHDRAEGEQQDDDRGQQADHERGVAFFFGAGFLDRLRRRARPGGRCRWPPRRSSISFLMSSLFDFVGGDVVLDGRVGDLAVLADRRGAAGCVGAGDFADVGELAASAKTPSIFLRTAGDSTPSSAL